MSMDFGYVYFDRIGKDWRITGERSESFSAELLPRLVDVALLWSDLSVIPFIAAPKAKSFVVTIQLAGEESRRVYQVFEHHDGVS